MSVSLFGTECYIDGVFADDRTDRRSYAIGSLFKKNGVSVNLCLMGSRQLSVQAFLNLVMYACMYVHAYVCTGVCACACMCT